MPEYKPVYSLLSDDDKIIIIEKFGYGFSDMTDDERLFETVLREDKKALSKAGMDGTFILCPHVMSGIEAILRGRCVPTKSEQSDGVLPIVLYRIT